MYFIDDFLSFFAVPFNLCPLFHYVFSICERALVLIEYFVYIKVVKLGYVPL